MKLLSALYWTGPSGRLYRFRVIPMIVTAAVAVAVAFSLSPYVVNPIIRFLRHEGLNRPTIAMIVGLALPLGFYFLIWTPFLWLLERQIGHKFVPRWLAKLLLVEVKSTSSKSL